MEKLMQVFDKKLTNEQNFILYSIPLLCCAPYLFQFTALVY